MPREVTWPLWLRPPDLVLPSVSALTGLPFHRLDRSTRIKPRRAGLVGLYCLSAIASDPARDVDRLAFGQRDYRLLGVRPFVGLTLPFLGLALGHDRVDVGHVDAEQRLDRGLDLGLRGAVGDLEDNGVMVRQHRRFLGDVRRQDDVVMA